MSKPSIIRDVIHLDIEFEERYMDLMDTREFQRLHRIKQLSCEYLVFPTALHSRFSHSIGTFHVMKLLIDSLTRELEGIGIEVKEEDRELGLIASLVHDIGHGPFSHTFEKIFNIRSHEMWASKILSEESCEINQKINKYYGRVFLKRLIDIITKQYQSETDNEIFSLIATLVSSQTDADRMDYLLRDSYFTSVTNGNFDLNRLIKSFGVKKEGKNLRIYVNEKYMSTLEEYVLARYFMHKEVYQHSTKKQMEIIMKKIFQRAKDLVLKGKNIFTNPIIKKLFIEGDISVQEYLSLDDTVFGYHINMWQDEDDLILSFLCKSFLNRNKFSRNIKHIDKNQSLKIKETINKKLQEKGLDPIVDFNKEYFYMETKTDVDLYVLSKENIWIMPRDSNELVDLTDKSEIITKEAIQNANHHQKRSYISPELLEISYGISL